MPHVIIEIVLALIVVALLISGAGQKRRADGLQKKLDDFERGGISPFAKPPAPSFSGTPVAAPSVPSGDFMMEVQRLVQANQLIPAIKLYRESTGLGLKESKDAVDALKRQMNL